MNSFTLRQLTPDDWPLYRDLRLEALRKHPAFFSPSRDETNFSESDWRARLSNPNSATFGLFSGSEMIGLTGIVREGNDPSSTTALLVSSYLQREFRGKGLSKLFFDARIQWAEVQGDIKTLILEHRDDNLPSQRAHAKFGFEMIGSEEQTWPDGAVRPSLKYQLVLPAGNT